MLRASQLFITGLTMAMASGLQADCVFPEDIVIPDGAISTYEEMSANQLFVKEYMAEMETYLDCLEQENATRTNSLTSDLSNNDLNNNDPNNNLSNNLANEESQLQHTEKRHAAIDAMESVAASFNEQVRAFKQVNP